MFLIERALATFKLFCNMLNSMIMMFYSIYFLSKDKGY